MRVWASEGCSAIRVLVDTPYSIARTGAR
jgi:hypothetical protein